VGIQAARTPAQLRPKSPESSHESPPAALRHPILLGILNENVIEGVSR
jgi:hypothetical protein